MTKLFNLQLVITAKFVYPWNESKNYEKWWNTVM